MVSLHRKAFCHATRRTGYSTTYSEHFVSFRHWMGSTILFRPELRLKHSYNLAAYDLGTKKSRFAAAGDMAYPFEERKHPWIYSRW